MKLKLFLFLPVMILSAIGTMGQSSQSLTLHHDKLIPKLAPKSPNVASLGRYGDYPVNFYTGLPDISIPLFEATSGGLSVPITLSYHAAGIRSTDVASWVGMGWSLSAGGQVSRSMVGRPDEKDFYMRTLNPAASLCADYPYFSLFKQGVMDTEPDMFSYSFPGKSGKFMLKQDGSLSADGTKPFYTIPYDPIVIAPTHSTANYSFPEFNIIDDRGIKYRFGKDEDGNLSVDETNSGGGGVDGDTRTAWYLTSMVDPQTSDNIKLTYQYLGFSRNDSPYSRWTFLDYHFLNSTPVGGGMGNLEKVTGVSGSLVSQYAPYEIFFAGGKLRFVKDVNNREDQIDLKSLNRIEIFKESNGVYTHIRSVKFLFSYFDVPNRVLQKRLKLDKVQITDETGAVIQEYSFDYYTTSFSWADAHQIDLWGFYNAAVGNTDLVPKHPVQISSGVTTSIVDVGGAVDRTTNPLYMTEGVLKKIHFPTGGYTEFEYETHKYQENSVTKYAGGLRVSRITSYDGHSVGPLEKTYKYGSGETGFGAKNFNDNLFNFSGQTMVRTEDNGCTLESYYIRSFLSSPSMELEGADGSPVVYPVVTEYYGNSTANIGKIVYEYDDGTYSAVNADFFYAIPSFSTSKLRRNSFAWKRGKQTKKSIYDASGNLLSATSTTYSPFQDRNIFAGQLVTVYASNEPNPLCLTTLNSMGVTTCFSAQLGYYVDSQEMFWQNYSQSSGIMLPTSINEKVYEPGNPSKFVSTTTGRTFDATYIQPLSQTSSSSVSGETIISKTRYPFSYTFTGSETNGAKALSILKTSNAISTPIETYTTVSRASSPVITAGSISTYKLNPIDDTKVVADAVYVLETARGIPVSGGGLYTESTTTSNALTFDSRYKPLASFKYNHTANLTQVKKTNDISVSYQWGYDDALPVAEVTNASNDVVFHPTTGTISNITFGGSTNAQYKYVYTTSPFTVYEKGTVKLKLGTGTGVNPPNPIYADYTGPASGTLALTSNQVCGYDVATINNVLPGTYTFTITLRATGSPATLGACGSIEYPSKIITGTTEFFYESFEENTNAGVTENVAVARTGARYYTGDPVISFTMPNARNYVIEYWYLDANSKWQHILKPYVGTSMTLTEGSAIDDVRIHPEDALMTTYTHAPLIGVSSVTDPSGQTSFYEYDKAGRLLLIRDSKGNIVKSHQYVYKGQQ